ncbi:hypothetical protein [Mycolicibacterium hippocampi]|uniref:Bacterial Pleckstrin homology domain-containing protein n=1 Tax=Mycolicibacterium hippocampi TaxID=659824 RepID=A0A7I9ZHY9_9MYCO|nr:hypothetical protein [Mycolicibacterium hippocampi]GFH00456.1 hypothetical protein MHIP_09390 [Mycolicibacterium hippocampi]
MAEIRRADGYLHVVLAPLEKVAALHGNVRVPLASVTSVTVADRPLEDVKGLRSPGLHIPARTKIGTWRRAGRRTFAVARARQTAVRIELTGERYDTLVVSVPDAATVAQELRTAQASP